MNITDLLRKRCLLKLDVGPYKSQTVAEFKVLEISPSGNWVKLMNIHGNKFWRSVTEISFVEELIDLKADKPKEEKKP